MTIKLDWFMVDPIKSGAAKYNNLRRLWLLSRTL